MNLFNVSVSHQKVLLMKKKLSINISYPKPSTLQVQCLKVVCCSHVVSGTAWVFTQVHSLVICIPWFITQFVNSDAKMFLFLGNILPEDNCALEFYIYLICCQMLQWAIEFTFIVSDIVLIFHSQSYFWAWSGPYVLCPKLKNVVCIKISLVSWSHHKTVCVAVCF
jgi:hypothetical protein